MSFNRIPKGSLVLVTGATGLVGSAVCDAALAHGLKVRAVTRSLSKAATFQMHLKAKYGDDLIEFVEVPDSTVAGAYDEALQGCPGAAGILHIATDTSMAPSYEAVVGGVVQSIVGLMKAAAQVPSVKAFVLTSSRIAAFAPDYAEPEIHPTLEQWSDQLTTIAQQIPTNHPMKPLLVYAASKVAGERAAWEYYTSAGPDYAFNTILPDFVIGPIFNPTPGTWYSTHASLNSLFLSAPDDLIFKFVMPASLAVDVRDVAAVHLAVLLLPQTNGKRLWAAAHRFEVNDFLVIWRKAFPDRTFVENIASQPQPKVTLDLDESEALLRAFAGRSWVPFEESVIANFWTAVFGISNGTKITGMAVKREELLKSEEATEQKIENVASLMGRIRRLAIEAANEVFGL
ncbi:hypothetical protein C8R45DRAFT_1068804 [Mycena sanguinolenta]|nr:hypothetical protein C8R45DRAFT_1068804 [Mycena sanguinolenta]